MSTKEAESRQFYNESLEHMSDEKSIRRYKYLKRGIDRCNMLPGCTALDLGCGVGVTTLYMARKGAKVVGVDFAEDLIAYASKFNSNANTSYMVGDITTLALDRQFDYIYLADVLEHVDGSRYADLFEMLHKHSHAKTIIYLNIPYLLFQRYGRNKFEQQPIDNCIGLASVEGLFSSINFVPFIMEIYGIEAPAQYVEIVFITLTNLINAWDYVYSEASVEDVTDVP